METEDAAEVLGAMSLEPPASKPKPSSGGAGSKFKKDKKKKKKPQF